MTKTPIYVIEINLNNEYASLLENAARSLPRSKPTHKITKIRKEGKVLLIYVFTHSEVIFLVELFEKAYESADEQTKEKIISEKVKDVRLPKDSKYRDDINFVWFSSSLMRFVTSTLFKR